MARLMFHIQNIRCSDQDSLIRLRLWYLIDVTVLFFSKYLYFSRPGSFLQIDAQVFVAFIKKGIKIF